MDRHPAVKTLRRRATAAEVGANAAVGALLGSWRASLAPAAPPFAAMAQAFLLQQHWWQDATTGVPGLTRHHEQMVAFAARQWLDLLAPSNSVLGNPVVRERTLAEHGTNLLRGALHAGEDLLREALDLMAWNADGTRLPHRMHSEYLHALCLDNALAHGAMRIDGTPINLHDIRVSIFNVSAVQDHVAPWRSVFKLHTYADTEQTFVLTAGGHNVGIVNPPGQPKSSYRLLRCKPGDRLLMPEEWLATAAPHDGSWWAAWLAWLARHWSPRARPPAMGAPDAGLPPLEAAPGLYIHLP